MTAAPKRWDEKARELVLRQHFHSNDVARGWDYCLGCLVDVGNLPKQADAIAAALSAAFEEGKREGAMEMQEWLTEQQ